MSQDSTCVGVNTAPLQIHHQIIDTGHELLEVPVQIVLRFAELSSDGFDASLVGGENPSP